MDTFWHSWHLRKRSIKGGDLPVTVKLWRSLRVARVLAWCPSHVREGTTNEVSISDYTFNFASVWQSEDSAVGLHYRENNEAGKLFHKLGYLKVVALITVHFAFGSFLLSQQVLFLCGCDMLISWKKCQILTSVYSPLGTLRNTNNPSTPDLTRHKGVSMSVFFLMFSITSLGISSQPGKFFELTKSETRSLQYHVCCGSKNAWFQCYFPLCLGKEINHDEIDTKENLI